MVELHLMTFVMIIWQPSETDIEYFKQNMRVVYLYLFEGRCNGDAKACWGMQRGCMEMQGYASPASPCILHPTHCIMQPAFQGAKPAAASKADHGRPKHSDICGATSISDAFIKILEGGGPSGLMTSSFGRSGCVAHVRCILHGCIVH